MNIIFKILISSSIALLSTISIYSQEFAFEKLCTPEIIKSGHDEFLKASEKNPSYTVNRFLGYGVTEQPTWEIYSKKIK